jgi:ADP-ribose pyrophosphatase YjhB (NUDIX family)
MGNFGNAEKTYPIPVVRLIITDADGRVLVLRRENTSHASGEWCLPGGKVDYGEAVEESIVKEVREETSLACVGSKFLFYQDSLPLQPGGMHCINLYFECRVEGTVLLNEESSDHAWILKGDLPRYSLTFRNDEGLLRYWREKQA